MVEKIHLKFRKMLLTLNKFTPSYMVYGELGRMPLKISVKTRTLSFVPVSQMVKKKSSQL